jgi:hypothetical protein
MDQLYAPLCFRLMIRHQPLAPQMPAVLLRQGLAGERPDRRGRSRSLHPRDQQRKVAAPATRFRC